jgi:hypothetical protein
VILFEYGNGRCLYFCSGQIYDLQELRLLPAHHKLQTECWLHQIPLILALSCRHIETLRHDRFKFTASFQELFGIEGGSGGGLQVESVDPLQGLLVV